MKRLTFCLTILLAMTSVHSAQIIVPTDYSSIQTAVDSAAFGDTIVILEGHYIQRVIVDSIAVTLASEYILDGDTGHIANTIIDADTSVIPTTDTGSVIIVTNVSMGQAKISGLTIQNGIGSNYSVFGFVHRVGGGILCANASVDINNCRVIDNRTLNFGGGIFSFFSNLQMRNCLIQNNECLNSGGGVALVSSAGSVVDSCALINNIGKDGGGAYIPYSTVTVQNSLFDSNDGLIGGAIYVEDNNTLISNCEFYDNTAFKGGAIYGFQGADGDIIGCNFVGNVAALQNSLGLGGAICILSSQPLIRNCTLHQNSADQGAGIYANNQSKATVENTIISSSTNGGAYFCSDDSKPTLLCCNVFGHIGGNYVGCLFAMQLFNSNIQLDPEYCLSDSRDVSLKQISPCLALNNACSTLIGANDLGCIVTDVNDGESILPNDYQLMQNYPNPFNPSTVIVYSIPQKSNVRITVRNILGQRIAVLIDEIKSAGTYEVIWNSHDQNGITVSSGMYFYTLETGEFKASRKMLLVR